MSAMGKRSQQIAAAAAEEGESLPAWLQSAPRLHTGYQHAVLSSFWTLSTCRQIAMGAVGPIPWTSIDHYAERYGFADEQDDYDDFVFLVMDLDEEFIRIKTKEIEKERERNRESGRVRGSKSSARKGR